MGADEDRSRLIRALGEVANGDRAALQIVYRQTSAKLLGVCLRILDDRTEAEDVLQETYITVWNRAGAFDPERGLSPITWLVTIARNKAIDRVRASRKARDARPIEEADHVADDKPAADLMLETAQGVHQLHHCLDELEPKHAQAVRTAFFEGLTYEVLAKRMAVPTGTMKSWIRRSLQRLRACLGYGMSDLPPIDPGDEPLDGADFTAAEYVLGLLGKKARADAEARSEADPAFGREIVDWIIRFAPLIEAAPSVEPSADLWLRIETVVGRPRLRLAPPAPAPFDAAPKAANDAAPRRGFVRWRVWALGAGAVAAAAVLFVGIGPTLHLGGHSGAPPVFAGKGVGNTLMATLSLTETKASAFTVAYDPVQATLYATPAGDFSVPHARSAELWLIPADGKPRPMGIVDPSKPAAMPMPPQFKALAKGEGHLGPLHRARGRIDHRAAHRPGHRHRPTGRRLSKRPPAHPASQGGFVQLIALTPRVAAGCGPPSAGSGSARPDDGPGSCGPRG